MDLQDWTVEQKTAAYETLQSMRCLIDEPIKWTQGAYTQMRETGRCFCMLGALRAVGSLGDTSEGVRARILLLRASGDSRIGVTSISACLTLFNDAEERKYSEVLAAVDLAISWVRP